MNILARSILATTVSLLLPLTGGQAATGGWTENESTALTQAKTEKKLVLLDFTGSDWCSWCKRMDKEVFNTPEFQAYAAEHLVLVEVDYPHSKPQAPEVVKQNEELKTQFNIEGFPTLVVLNSEGKMLKSFVGYQEGGPKAFIDELKKLQG